MTQATSKGTVTSTKPGHGERQRDKDRTRAEILRIAADEFARQGYAGARVDEIAARTSTTKRMIYYYFGGKEQLYVAVLEQAYSQIRDAELAIDVERLEPVAAIRRLAELTFDHHDAHPDFIRLVSIENIHEAVHLATLPTLHELRAPTIEMISRILDAGRAERGLHRAGRRPGRAHADQLVLRIQDRQPVHVPCAVRPRPDRPGPAGGPAPDARRPRGRVPDQRLSRHSS